MAMHPGLKVVPQIVAEVCRYFGVTQKHIRGPSRHMSLNRPRAIAMFLSRRHAKNTSWREIGLFFNGRHHSTVFLASGRVAKWLIDDPDVRRQVSEIEQRLFGKACRECAGEKTVKLPALFGADIAVPCGSCQREDIAA